MATTNAAKTYVLAFSTKGIRYNSVLSRITSNQQIAEPIAKPSGMARTVKIQLDAAQSLHFDFADVVRLGNAVHMKHCGPRRFLRGPEVA